MAVQMEAPKPTVLELADRYRSLRERKEQLEADLKSLNADLDATEQQLVAAMMAEEMQSFSRGDKKFVLSVRTFASPVADQREAVYAWLKAHGYADLVKETVHAQTFSAWVNERIEEDGGLPDDLAAMVNVHERPGIQMRKA